MCDIIFLPQITQISLLYSPSNVFFSHRLLPYGISFFRHEDMRTWSFLTEIIISHGIHGMHGILFISHRWHRFFRYAQDFVLLRYKNLTYNKIRSLTASNALYGFTQIVALRHFFFLDMKTWEHDLLSRRLFSPTDCTNFTSLFSLKCLFIPQIVALRHFFF